MIRRPLLAVAVTIALALPAIGAANADNAMGYRLVTQSDAAALPHHGASLGLDVAAGKRIAAKALSFELIRISRVRPGSPGAAAGLRVGDQIIAVDGRVFDSLVAFAKFVGSLEPGTRLSIDYIPAGGNVGSAQRITMAAAAATPQQTGSSEPGSLPQR